MLGATTYVLESDSSWSRRFLGFERDYTTLYKGGQTEFRLSLDVPSDNPFRQIIAIGPFRVKAANETLNLESAWSDEVFRP